MKEQIAVTLNRKYDLPALLNAGADIIIAAAQNFSSTALTSFEKEDLLFLQQETEAQHRTFAVLVNKLFHEPEIDDLTSYLLWLEKHHIQEVWFQDPCVPAIREKEHLSFACVYMPDTLLTSKEDLEVWIRMGAACGVISPLLNIEEEKPIALDPHAIVPVHGHFLMSRSYRKLLSAWNEAYDLSLELSHRTDLTLRERKREGQMPVYEDETGTLIYTDYVLNSFRVFHELRRADGIYLINSVYMDRGDVLPALEAYRQLISGASPAEVEEDYRHKCPDVLLDEGYYHVHTA